MGLLAAAVQLSGMARGTFDAAEQGRIVESESEPATGGNLPPQPPPLIGCKEVVEVRDRLMQSDIRLLTITGPDGVGKTRLALRVAKAAEPALKDGLIQHPGDPS